MNTIKKRLKALAEYVTDVRQSAARRSVMRGWDRKDPRMHSVSL